MLYKFVFGGSGSGKTHNIYKECIESAIKKPDDFFIVLVPEQYTMQTQKAIVKLHPNHATDNIDVLSFNRLAYRVFNELNIINPEIIDDTGKVLILRKVAQNKKSDLGVWKNQFEKPGFVSNMKSMISEFYQYGVKPSDIENTINTELKPAIKNKLSDILTVYKGFADYIQEKYITTEEILDVLCKHLSESKVVKDTTIYLDGYTGYTPVQYRLIGLLMLHAKQVIFTVTMGDDEDPFKVDNKTDLFSMSKDMIKKITDIAIENHIINSDNIRLNIRPYKRFSKSEDLDFFEQHFLRYDGKASVKQVSSINIVKTKNPKAEITYVAGQIIRLVIDKGYRYRDIAVICGDLDNYKSGIITEFHAQNIPYYLDDNLDITSNPFPEFIRAALACISENYSYDSIMRYLKSGLVTEDMRMVDIVDNYMLELGIRGYLAMKKSWDYIPHDIMDANHEKLNAFKNQILDDLLPLHEALLGSESSVNNIIDALMIIIEKLDIKDKITKYAEMFKINENGTKQREYERVYDEVILLLGKMRKLLGDQLLAKEEFAGLLDAGLSEISVGMIPASADRLVIGDITRTRLDEVKAIFLVGANDGIIPKAKESGCILTDREKESLKTVGLELSPTIKEDLYIQRYYLYRMLTKPSEKLVVSYTTMGFDGKALRESSILKQIERLFKYPIRIDADKIGDIYSSTEAKRIFIENMRKLKFDDKIIYDDNFINAYAYLNMESEKEYNTESLIDAATYFYKEDAIGHKAAIDLFGCVLKGSVTRLEQFSQCEYAHFLKYGLTLLERRIHSIEAVDIGNLVHETVEKVFTAAKNMDINITLLDVNARDKLVEECVIEALLSDELGKYTDSARSKYITNKLTSIAQKSIMVLAEQLKGGDFIPYAFELPFSEQDNLKSMNIELSENESLSLRGKIDRVDICKTDNKILIKIIDYKTGSTKWDYSSVIAGTQIQLITYLDAVLELIAKQIENFEILPAAMFYYNIDNPIIDLSDDKLLPEDENEKKDYIARTVVRALRPSGIVNANLDIIKHLDHDIEHGSDIIPVVVNKTGLSSKNIAGTQMLSDLREYVRNSIADTGREILSGHIAVNPIEKEGQITACTWCPYSAVCGFDKKTEGFAYKKMLKFDQEEFWKKVGGE